MMKAEDLNNTIFSDNLPTLTAYKKMFELAKHLESQLSELRDDFEHFKVNCIGLWATDRPDLIDDPNELLFEIKENVGLPFKRKRIAKMEINKKSPRVIEEEPMIRVCSDCG